MLRNNASARSKLEFAEFSMQCMSDKGGRRESRSPPCVSNHLNVLDTGKQLVLVVSRTIKRGSLYKKVNLETLLSYN